MRGDRIVAAGPAVAPAARRSLAFPDGLLLPGLVEFFEEGAASGKGVLQVIGTDVAAFCDDLIKDSRTYADVYQESVKGKADK